MSLLVRLANRAYMVAATPAHGRFKRALRDPANAQWAVLRRLLRQNAESSFGKAHGFASINSLADYRRRIPVRRYEDFAFDVDRAAAGERGVLTTDDVRFFEPTSGSSGASKLVPYTAGLLREFSAATMPWICDLLHGRPALRDGRSYWAITPPARKHARTAGGIPVGLEHDSEYFPAFVRGLLDRLLVAPRAIARAPDVPTCRYLTLRALLGASDLAFISVWNPSFLTLLADAMDENFQRLLSDMETGELSIELEPSLRAALSRALPADATRAANLRRRFGVRPPDDIGSLWKGLDLISCWTDGHAGRALEQLRQRFPRCEVQGKGLLATEGVISIPWFDAGGPVAAVTSHFLEFVAPGADEVCELHELQEGQAYEVLLSTSGGFYRYRLKDLVRVEGWHHRTPVLSFRGRADRTSDLAGEKLTPEFVESALDEAGRACAQRARFTLLAPVWGSPPRYHLYVEHDADAADRLAAELERCLSASHHYALCRALGQLDSVRGVSVTAGAATYERICVERGQRSGAIKPAVLDEFDGWDKAFGVYESSEVA